ncbi:DUF6634 family protein [Aminobacter sp. HY435]|uniref:DUF6634 family protein n=1 Tax=Aminobacter sp. HY435 TaxID=2970917 RepID=UPI0022B9C323|nr:DUF6634 family protein [Aminobacter sp. HY435]
MVMFDTYKAVQDAAFDLELERLSALVADMRKIRTGMQPEHLAEQAPILDHWVIGRRLAPCLAGLSTGHPKLPGENRAIATSDLWAMSADGTWARTLSRWYRLGRPADNPGRDA